MKRRYLIIVIIFLAIMNSCENKDDEISFDDPLLVGSIYQGNLTLRRQASVDLYGSQNITKIAGGLGISSQLDDPVIDLTPLSTILEVESLTVYDNLQLETLEGLENLRNFESINIIQNGSLKNINAINLDSSYEGAIRLDDLPSFDNFDAIREIQNLSTLSLSGLNLSSLEPISNLKNITGSLNLTRLNGLENLQFLSLESLGGRLTISKNNHLETLQGIESLQVVGPFSDVEINQNPELINFCGLEVFTQLDSFPDFYMVFLNGINPTAQDIIDGNCS